MAARVLPSGSCDCHVHVIGDRTAYPMTPDRHYTPGPASVADLLAHLAHLGADRAVIVQPSVYGTDNRCLIESLERLAGAGRGVAVVEPQVGQDELQALHHAGVRGLRINLESAQVREPRVIAQALQYWSERIGPLGWHLQVYASLDAMSAAAAHLDGVDVPIVMDHFAMVPPTTGAGDVRLQTLLGLLETGRAYVKLSAPYRIGSQPLDAGGDANALASLWVAANPERVLWASDWPHTGRDPAKPAHEVSAYRPIHPGWLLRDVANWLPDAATRRQVLVDNPARLYDF